MQKIVIISPTCKATGGTELLQQLCYHLNQVGKSAFMYYVGNYENSPVQKKFLVYNNPYIMDAFDEEKNIVIIPETEINFMYKIKKAQYYIWWLSVDNYYGSRRKEYSCIYKILYFIEDKRNSYYFLKTKHLVQSQYAKKYLIEEKSVPDKQIYFLSDYINPEYMLSKIDVLFMKKRNIILYNPKKGLEFTQKLVRSISEYEWKPLENLTNGQMRLLLEESKLYVDFGNHPGKDRIPREAAMCGCCIITGKRGAAGNDEDVAIPEDYKFDENLCSIESIHLRIKYCMENFSDAIKDFEYYRTKIRNEEENFKNEIKMVFDIK